MHRGESGCRLAGFWIRNCCSCTGACRAADRDMVTFVDRIRENCAKKMRILFAETVLTASNREIRDGNWSMPSLSSFV